MMMLEELRNGTGPGKLALDRLEALARDGQGAILEIGINAGPVTIALATGHKGRRRHAAIEAQTENGENGGASAADQTAEWCRNAVRFGVEPYVRILPWVGNTDATMKAAIHETGPLSLCVLYPRVNVHEQMSRWIGYMEPGCLLAVDLGTINSSTSTQISSLKWIERMTQLGGLVGHGVVGSIWFGQIGKLIPQTTEYFRYDGGYAWLRAAPVPYREMFVRVYEDGVPLGPAQALHADVRSLGNGRYSHWLFDGAPMVMFSTSDNSNPNENGRRYEFRGRI